MCNDVCHFEFIQGEWPTWSWNIKSTKDIYWQEQKCTFNGISTKSNRKFFADYYIQHYVAVLTGQPQTGAFSMKLCKSSSDKDFRGTEKSGFLTGSPRAGHGSRSSLWLRALLFHSNREETIPHNLLLFLQCLTDRGCRIHFAAWPPNYFSSITTKRNQCKPRTLLNHWLLMHTSVSWKVWTDMATKRQLPLCFSRISQHN